MHSVGFCQKIVKILQLKYTVVSQIGTCVTIQKINCEGMLDFLAAFLCARPRVHSVGFCQKRVKILQVKYTVVSQIEISVTIQKV